jgi:aminoglycoside phosphotransferase (APT) family kinase protein
VVKYGRDVRYSEALAMDFVRNRAPTIPVPRVIAVYQRCETDGSRSTFIVSEWISGQSLATVWEELSEKEKDSVFDQLRAIVRALRKVHPHLDAYYVGAAGHMPCTDHILFDQGPFSDIPSFNAALTDLARPHFRWNWLSVVERSLARTNGYRILFTHGDLHISNILVRQSMPSSIQDAHKEWRIVALLDWECAGWYPEHWEYVKILSSVKWRSDWAAYAQHVLDRHYDEEFLLDNRLRMHLGA